MNWNDLLHIEPRLVRAQRLAEDACQDGLCWADFFNQIHAVLHRLVGFGAEEATLRTTESYDVAVAYLTGVWDRGVPRHKTLSTRPWDGATCWDIDDAAERATAEPAAV